MGAPAGRAVMDEGMDVRVTYGRRAPEPHVECRGVPCARHRHVGYRAVGRTPRPPELTSSERQKRPAPMWNGALLRTAFNELPTMTAGHHPYAASPTIPYGGICCVSSASIPACPRVIPTGQRVACAENRRGDTTYPVSVWQIVTPTKWGIRAGQGTCPRG